MERTSIRILISVGVFLFLTIAAGYLLKYKLQKPTPSATPQSASLKGLQTGIQGADKTTAVAAKKGTHEKKKDIVQAEADDRPAWVQAALEGMKNPDVGIRVQAVLALRDHASPEAIELLEGFLADEDISVIEEAIDTLGFIGLNSEHKALIFKILAEKAKDLDFVSRGTALIAAAVLGEDDKILPIIGEYIAAKDSEENTYAVRAMGVIASPECFPYLAEVLASEKDPEIQRNSFNILAKIGTQEAMDLLKDNLYSKDEQMQAGSVWALTRRKNDTYNEMLTEAMTGNKLGSESLSIVARSPAAPAVFGEALQMEDIPKEDKLNWLNVLAANTVNASGTVRNDVAQMLYPLLDSPDPDIQQKAIKALGKVGASQDQSKVLVSKLESDNFLVQGAALNAFAQYCTPTTYKPLIKLWDHEDEKIRRTAFFLSEAFLNQSDREAVQKATQSKDEFIVKQSKTVLKYIDLGE